MNASVKNNTPVSVVSTQQNSTLNSDFKTTLIASTPVSKGRQQLHKQAAQSTQQPAAKPQPKNWFDQRMDDARNMYHAVKKSFTQETTREVTAKNGKTYVYKTKSLASEVPRLAGGAVGVTQALGSSIKGILWDFPKSLAWDLPSFVVGGVLDWRNNNHDALAQKKAILKVYGHYIKHPNLLYQDTIIKTIDQAKALRVQGKNYEASVLEGQILGSIAAAVVGPKAATGVTGSVVKQVPKLATVVKLTPSLVRATGVPTTIADLKTFVQNLKTAYNVAHLPREQFPAFVVSARACTFEQFAAFPQAMRLAIIESLKRFQKYNGEVKGLVDRFKLFESKIAKQTKAVQKPVVQVNEKALVQGKGVKEALAMLKPKGGTLVTVGKAPAGAMQPITLSNVAGANIALPTIFKKTQLINQINLAKDIVNKHLNNILTNNNADMSYKDFDANIAKLQALKAEALKLGHKNIANNIDAFLKEVNQKRIGNERIPLTANAGGDYEAATIAAIEGKVIELQMRMQLGENLDQLTEHAADFIKNLHTKNDISAFVEKLSKSGIQTLQKITQKYKFELKVYERNLALELLQVQNRAKYSEALANLIADKFYPIPEINPVYYTSNAIQLNQPTSTQPKISVRSIVFIRNNGKLNGKFLPGTLVGNPSYVQTDSHNPEKLKNAVISRLVHSEVIHDDINDGKLYGHDISHVLFGFGIDQIGVSSNNIQYPHTGIDAHNNNVSKTKSIILQPNSAFYPVSLNGILIEAINSSMMRASINVGLFKNITEEIKPKFRSFIPDILKNIDERNSSALGAPGDPSENYQRQAKDFVYNGMGVGKTNDNRIITTVRPLNGTWDSIISQTHYEDLLKKHPEILSELRHNAIEYIKLIAQYKYNQSKNLAPPVKGIEFGLSPYSTHKIIEYTIENLVALQSRYPTSSSVPELINFYRSLLKNGTDGSPHLR